jgi:hypothetical protein
VVKQVSAAIILRMGYLINWPDDPDARRKIGQKFFRLSNPGLFLFLQISKIVIYKESPEFAEP